MTPESNHRISCVDVRELGFLPSTRTLGNSWAQLDSIIHAGTIACNLWAKAACSSGPRSWFL
jgi:hypothetical protein